MTSRKRNRKKTAICSTILLSITAAALFFLPASAGAQSIEEYQRHVTIGGTMPVSLIILGYSHDKAQINQLIDVVVSKANQAYYNMDWRNSQGEVFRVNSLAGAAPVEVSPEVFAAFQAAKKISEWSGGAFDITYYKGSGNYKDIRLNDSSKSVQLKSKGMEVRFDDLAQGLIADIMIRYIYHANMHNAMVKAGSVFRGLGQGMHGPWKITMEEDSGAFARHALNLVVSNTGIAAISASEFRGVAIIDPRSKSPTYVQCKGAVVVMSDAALAQGIARAAFVLGPEKGMELLSKYAKGVIVDNNGKFIRSPGF
ncbi:MAG: hypothetical protein GX659_00305 [Myxococcales bacterium]|nr:hypothetical protein [Myxococcales bacterium]